MTSSKERKVIEACLLDSIKKEIELVEYLRQKYNLSFKIHTHTVTLCRQRKEIKAGYYFLERQNLDGNIEMVTAYFKDGTSVSCRRLLSKTEEKEIV